MGKYNVLSDILRGQTQQGPSVFTDFLSNETHAHTHTVYTVRSSHIQKPEVLSISSSASQSSYCAVVSWTAGAW